MKASAPIAKPDDIRKFDQVVSGDISKQQKAILIAGEQKLAAIADTHLVEGFFAGSTVRAYSSETRLYEKVMNASRIAAWPVTRLSLFRFAGILKVTEFSAGPYLSAIMTTHRMCGYPVGQDLEHAVTLARRYNNVVYW